MFGNGSFHKFYEKNKWVENYLPNKTVTEGLSKLNLVMTKFSFDKPSVTVLFGK